MLRNYIKIAIRHFLRHKLFSAINILCLSIGISFSMVIGLFVFTQLRTNSYLRNSDRQYFLKSVYTQKDLGLDITSISPLAKALKEEYPNLVANYYRYNPVTNVVSAGDKHFKEDIAIGDTTLVSIYGFPLLHGDPKKAFPNNSSAVITEHLAKKLFGTTNAIGKTINIQTTQVGLTQDYSVSAVLKEIPYNSVTNLIKSNYTVFIPTTGSLFFKGADPSLSWDNTNQLAFVELQPGVATTSVLTAANSLIKARSADFVSKALSATMVPVKDYHLKDNGGAINKMITILSLVTIFILLMVVINFVNINIGTSSYRLKEIGLRKTFGGERRQVMGQFLAEAYLLSLAAAIISCILYQLLNPVFSQLLQVKLPALWQFHLTEYTMLLGLVVLIGFLAGVYPAFVLSATDLVIAVKGKISNTTGGLLLKRVLLVLQFALAIIVFICSIDVSRQVSYIFNKDLGYNREQLLVITAFPKNWDSAGVAKMQSIKAGLEQLPSVKQVSLSFDLPDQIPNGRIVLHPPENTGLTQQLNLPLTTADEDYAKTFGIKMKAGSFFGEAKDGLVLNEAAVRQLGLTVENAVGRSVASIAGGAPITISGVLQDFHISSLQDKIGPVGFVHTSNNLTYRYLSVRIGSGNMFQAIETIKSKWKQFSPAAPFDYTFMDEKFAALYSAELQLRTAANIATVLNLIIVLLGIIGVMSFMLARRNKEIAVRKVLGADAIAIIGLFIKEYALLLLIANIIAWPLAYMISANLLQGFAYRVDQTISPYLVVFGSMLLMSFTLIGLQSFRTATANPVSRLRSE